MPNTPPIAVFNNNFSPKNNQEDIAAAKGTKNKKLLAFSAPNFVVVKK